MRNDDESKTMGRREAARRVLVVLGAAALAPSVLAACGGEDGGELSCNHTTGLTAAQTQTRQQQAYVDQTPNPAQRCDGCRFYTAAAQSGGCGGCQVLAGPIHPAGYCNLFAVQA